MASFIMKQMMGSQLDKVKGIWHTYTRKRDNENEKIDLLSIL